MLAFYSPNSIDTPVLNLGLHWAAGTASPANPTYTTEELARQLEDCGARLIVTQAAYLESVLAAARQVGLTERDVILLGDERRDGFRHWTDIASEAEGLVEISKPAINPKKDVAYLVYSSVRPPPFRRRGGDIRLSTIGLRPGAVIYRERRGCPRG